MSAETKIEWTDATLSPWIGCSPVSAGCAHCYVPTTAPARVHGVKLGGPRLRVKTFRAQALALNRKAERVGRRLRVFPSLCDWLDAEVPIEWLADLLDVVRLTPALDWQLLTKRPALFRDRLVRAKLHRQGECNPMEPTARWILRWVLNEPPSNVWIGTSIEHQRAADERVPALLAIPAVVRFVSLEPLLEEVTLDLLGVVPESSGLPYSPLAQHIRWGIVGGESGPEARPCNVEWVHSLVTEFAEAGVPLFVKQLGRHTYLDKVGAWDGFVGILSGKARQDPAIPGRLWARWKHPKGGDPAEWPEALNVRQMPEGSHV